MKRGITVGYKRTSFDDLTGEILKRQESEISDFCNRRNLTAPVFFEDSGVSGGLSGRAGWSALLDFIARSNGRIKNLVVVDYDRISRDSSEVEQEIKRLRQNYSVKVLATQKFQSVKQLVEMVKMEQKKYASRKRSLK